jgi:hypothetical protein
MVAPRIPTLTVARSRTPPGHPRRCFHSQCDDSAKVAVRRSTSNSASARPTIGPGVTDAIGRDLRRPQPSACQLLEEQRRTHNSC